MVSHLVYYQLALLAIIWLFVMLHLTGPKPGRTTPPVPVQPKRKRSTEPKAFEGLTHKPHCALCERETAHPQAPPPVPPDPMPRTNRRPREVDTSMHFCPHLGCDYRGWRGCGNLRANGHPSGGPWRQFHCTSCQGYFLETHGTLFHGKQAAVELIVRVLACLAEGLGIRATARVFEVDPNTVLHWLVEAAGHLRTFSSYFLCDLHVEQLQLDELYAVLRVSKPARSVTPRRSNVWSARPTGYGRRWTPEQTAGGDRCGQPHSGDGPTRRASGGPRCWRRTVYRCFLTDGLKDYSTALLAHFGYWRQPERRQDKGPRPKPRWMPLPELHYAQVVKSYRRRRLVGVKHRVVFGTQLAIEQVSEGMWLEHQYRLCGTTQPRYPPARRGSGASSEH